MAEVKNAFLKSKMNKDLDSRLVPSGEYRDAVNVQVIKSEGEDVGALENVQGNVLVANFDALVGGQDLVCIGYFADQNSGRVYAFFTNNFSINSEAYNPSGLNLIAMWDSNNVVGNQEFALVNGAFLNFHENFPIIGVNVLENLLFFTDNRNQPRKINIDNALNQSNYYTTEDQISVAKYNPYQAIEVFSISDNPLAQIDDSSGNPITITTTQSVVNSNRVEVSSLPVELTTGLGIKSPQHVNGELDQVVVVKKIPADPGPPATNDTLQFNQRVTLNSGDTLEFYRIETSMYDVVSEYIPLNVLTTPPTNINNPYREIDYPGDPQFLEDKFVRFSYRFKFDDNEYSILAPFTQACFIPKQDGYFLEGDEQQTFSSTVVEFAQNKVNKIDLHIPLPCTGNQLSDEYKVTELDIIYKESDGLAVQVVETIPIDRVQDVASSSNYFTFTYRSTKPYKTLPESELIRVYDKVPVKAFSQEVASNRIIYGNFQDKHTPPDGIDYQVLASQKIDITTQNSSLGVVEYPASNVKENRNYQVGVVLSDKFGRQSTVILSSNTNSVSSATGFGADTVYLPYRDEDSTGAVTTEAWDWLGASLKIQFNETINQPQSNLTGTPGLYNGDSNSISYNPLGWYSYKIVVKQVEQDYYNVYSAGAMKDIPFNYDTFTPPTVGNEIEPNTSFITLLNDNINKVPRDLSEVGPQDKSFRSSVKLFGRVMNNTNTYSTTGNEQFSQQNFGTPGRTVFTTNNIEDLFDLFDVSQFKDVVDQNVFVTNAGSPFYSFFKADSNPFIAEFVTSQNSDFQFGVLNELTSSVKGTADVNGAPPNDTSAMLTNLTPGGLEITAGDLVTANSGIEANTYVVSYNGATGILVFNRAQPNLTAGTQLTFSTQQYLKIENLAVLETTPTVSKLDIFWETSTSGLVSDLNTAVNEGTTGAVAIDDFDFVAFENALPEGTIQDPITGASANPTDLINNSTNSFAFIDNSNQTIIPQSVVMIVTDNANNTLNDGVNTGKFVLISAGSGRYKLRLATGEYFYYEGTTFGGRNTFNFEFIVTDSNNDTTTLYPDLGILTELQNVAPVVNLPTIDPIKYTDTKILDLLNNENGSKDPTQFRKNLIFSISNISGPSGQTPTSSTYGFTLNTTSSTPTNGQVSIDQPAKSTTGTPNAGEESNFGYYTYDVTVTDEGGMSTTVSLTATIGIPNMVDHFQNVSKILEQANGSVEFFADSLTNLNSTAVIPSNYQVGYTTTNLGYLNPVDGNVCTTGVNDAKYFARAAEAKPITAPSSTFYVYFKLLEASFGTANPRIGGTYAAIEYRAIGASTWSIATDAFGNQCVFDNLYENKVTSTGQVVLAGMTEEDQGNYPNQLRMNNIDSSQSNPGSIPGGFILSRFGGRVFALNDTGEYRIASGNVYNNYSAFLLSGGKQCNDTPDLETNVEYYIGDLANVPTGSSNQIRGQLLIGSVQNIYEYSIGAWAQGTATCGTGTFQATGVSFYSACPVTRYLFAPNETIVSGGSTGGDDNAIFSLWDNDNLTGKFTSSTNVPQTGTIANPFYTRIARADGNNPEGTRDGTYLLVYPGSSGGPEILNPCFDSEQANSSSSSDSGTGTGTDTGGEGGDDLPDLDGPDLPGFGEG